MTKIELLQKHARLCNGISTSPEEDEWKFNTAKDFLAFLNVVEDAGLVRPADFNTINHDFVAWANEFMKDQEVQGG